jgi:hypothetical protein
MISEYQRDYLNGIYIIYLNSDDEAFLKDIMDKAKLKMKNGIIEGELVEEELLHMSNCALEISKELNEQLHNDKSWSGFSFCLKRVAQKIFTDSGERSKMEGFLRLVK